MQIYRRDSRSVRRSSFALQHASRELTRQNPGCTSARCCYGHSTHCVVSVVCRATVVILTVFVVQACSARSAPIPQAYQIWRHGRRSLGFLALPARCFLESASPSAGSHRLQSRKLFAEERARKAAEVSSAVWSLVWQAILRARRRQTPGGFALPF